MDKTSLVVFDFDGTLYAGDCTVNIHWYILKKSPLKFILLPWQVVCFLLWRIKLLPTQIFKQQYLLYLYGINPTRLNALLQHFWSNEFPRKFNQEIINALAHHTKAGHHCIISTASPEIFIQPLLTYFKDVKLEGTKLKYGNGVYSITGKNNKGPEKISRLASEFGAHISLHAAYSDNKSDQALLQMAKHPYYIKSGKLIPLKSRQ